jgi:hypothetical protein
VGLVLQRLSCLVVKVPPLELTTTPAKLPFNYRIASTGLEHDPIVNGGEVAVLYCFLFLYIAAHGSGIWSVDASVSKTGNELSHMVESGNP